MPRCPTCFRRLAGGKSCPDDGSVAGGASRTPDVEPPLIPGMTLGNRLGEGGFALVWAAKRDRDGAPIAVKITRDGSDLAHARLDRECDVLAHIGGRFVPRYFDRGRLDDGRSFMAMERLRGQPLSAALEGMARAPHIDWIRPAASGLLDAVDAVHSRGFVHRDLKPENVFLLPDLGDVKLLDFGLTVGRAPEPDTRLTRAGTQVGTAEYMAPEQVRASDDIGESADIYSLGAILYEMFTLRPPFVGDQATIENGHLALRPRRPSKFAAVAQPIERVILACLAKEPDRRPATVAELRFELETAYSKSSGPGRISQVITTLLTEKRKPAVLLALVGEVGTAALGEVLLRHGGFLARRRGNRAIGVFPGSGADDPVAAAIKAADELVADHAARAIIHLTKLAIRQRGRRAIAVGEPLDAPETWLPASDWVGTILTRQLAETQIDRNIEPVSECPGYFFIADADGRVREPTLFGRDDALGRAESSFKLCLDSERPALLTVIGASGSGKSRMAREIAAACEGLEVEVHSVVVSAAHDPDRARDQILSALETAGAIGEADAAAPLGGPLALIVDDAHRLDPETLGAIELATLGHHPVPLWIAVIADPELEDAHTRWGQRAERHDRVALEPLVGAPAEALAAELLLPAEYPPAELLRRLASWADGKPRLLVEIITALKGQGAVRQREHGVGWYLVTTQLESLPARAASQWVASRDLAQMTPELASCVRVCAVLGASFYRSELDAILDAADERGAAATTMDTDVGLARLIELGTLQAAGPGRFAFSSSAFQDAVYKLLEPEDRELIHGIAADLWLRRLGDDRNMALEHFARHAAHCGQAIQAAEAYTELGERARVLHRHVEAEQHYNAALRLSELTSVRLPALAGRGRVRAITHKTRDALEDIVGARELAGTLRYTGMTIDLLLDEAWIADSAADYKRAEACVEHAERLFAEIDDERLRTRQQVATGRICWRKGDVQSATRELGLAIEGASELGDHETEIHAGLLLGPAFVFGAKLDEARRIFDRVIELASSTGDRLHECAAYGNRIYLWEALNQPERAIEDLRRAVEIAREIGNPEPERVATHNLAELLYWSGDLEEALSLAQRARLLQVRFWNKVPHDALLLARIHAALGEAERARDLLGWIERRCAPDQLDRAVLLLAEAVSLVVTPGLGDADAERATWDALLEQARAELPPAEMLELLWWRAAVAVEGARWDEASASIDEANERLGAAPIWEQRITELATQAASRAR